mmetsp:Transcript_29039/g.94635  ORF Transcript_29039/g.94635 Transcript_29039/m.94635 type:complete len:282 (-) Transcript_29039:1853-2698(-)
MSALMARSRCSCPCACTLTHCTNWHAHPRTRFGTQSSRLHSMAAPRRIQCRGGTLDGSSTAITKLVEMPVVDSAPARVDVLYTGHTKLVSAALKCSCGRKWMGGIGACISRGSASVMMRLSSSHLAHSRYKPVTTTPSSGMMALTANGRSECAGTIPPSSSFSVGRIDCRRFRIRLRCFGSFSLSLSSLASRFESSSICFSASATTDGTDECSTLNEKSSELMGILYLRAWRCRAPVRKPCGKKNAGRWNSGGSPRCSQRRMKATRSSRSFTQDARGRSDG